MGIVKLLGLLVVAILIAGCNSEIVVLFQIKRVEPWKSDINSPLAKGE